MVTDHSELILYVWHTANGIKGSKERLFITTQTHNLPIFGVIPFVKLQNDT